MFCPKCGANVPDNQAFCVACGTQLAAQKKSFSLDTVKAACKNDKKFIFRALIVALALLSIILIFSKGISVHIDDSDFNTVWEWDSYFKTCCDMSKGLPLTMQILSIVFVVGAAVAIALPIFMPQLNKIKGFDLIPIAVAALNILLFAIMLIVGIASFEGGKSASAFPAVASWLYIADLIAIIVASVKMNKAGK
jgi:hypothetical protein